MLTIEELQKPRSPKELNEYFWSTYDNATHEEQCLGRLKQGLWKNFFHELTVLNIFSNWKFPDNDVIVEYIIGNQGYDAKITNGLSVEYIEITFPILGEQNKLEAIKVNHKGHSFVCRNILDIRNLSELKRRFTCTAESKSKKDYSYPASSLIFALDMFPLLKINISVFIEILRKFKFKSQSVYLVPINTNQPDINKKVCVVK